MFDYRVQHFDEHYQGCVKDIKDSYSTHCGLKNGVLMTMKGRTTVTIPTCLSERRPRRSLLLDTHFMRIGSQADIYEAYLLRIVLSNITSASLVEVTEDAPADTSDIQIIRTNRTLDHWTVDPIYPRYYVPFLL